MRGEIGLGEVYSQRLELVMPTREEVRELAAAYVESVQVGAGEIISSLRSAGLRVVLVTAGLREAILPLAVALGLAGNDVHAVRLYFGQRGKYAGFDTASPLTRSAGKVAIVRGLALEKPILAVGDGITDLELRTSRPPAVDAFVAYTGVVKRAEVTRAADFVINRFDELTAIVFP